MITVTPRKQSAVVVLRQAVSAITNTLSMASSPGHLSKTKPPSQSSLEATRAGRSKLMALVLRLQWYHSQTISALTASPHPSQSTETAPQSPNPREASQLHQTAHGRTLILLSTSLGREPTNDLANSLPIDSTSPSPALQDQARSGGGVKPHAYSTFDFINLTIIALDE